MSIKNSKLTFVQNHVEHTLPIDCSDMNEVLVALNGFVGKNIYVKSFERQCTKGEILTMWKKAVMDEETTKGLDEWLEEQDY